MKPLKAFQSSQRIQKSIEPRPSRQNSRTLRGQSTQQLMTKDPTLAQVSLPSPIYGLEEAGFDNSEITSGGVMIHSCPTLNVNNETSD